MKPLIVLPVLVLVLSACGKKEEVAVPSIPSVSPPPQTAPAPPAAVPEAPAVPVQAPHASAERAMAVSDRYVVARGDTLSSIARKHGLNHRDLARWNDIRDPRRLRVGQELRLNAPGN
ncbi:MAG: LysM domain-containing protein [Candidatus Methylophosphatis roskildensis]|uniref:LysM peptidoglycan-binding domain-containing protein n=1 Tax=Candidatus Methylophosphatis roskildensis TaxID=2899263 RepID=A0A9D7DX71_9PROT|nr:LysM peptidoglycan-binding domain-containing protein [Candidatus Methylophosphatis roskildensis]MBK7235973.1 LysM peptidoglycan-binding domain-containing protein [Sterolibacteriaceae bacterium]